MAKTADQVCKVNIRYIRTYLKNGVDQHHYKNKKTSLHIEQLLVLNRFISITIKVKMFLS